MTKNIIINLCIGILLGLLVPTVFGYISAYTPLKESTFLYITSCGHEPVVSQSIYCRYTNIFFLSLHDLINLFPVSLLMAFILIRAQNYLSITPSTTMFSLGYIVALSFQNYLISFNPFYSSLSFVLTIVGYGNFIVAYFMLQKISKANTLSQALKVQRSDTGSAKNGAS